MYCSTPRLLHRPHSSPLRSKVGHTLTRLLHRPHSSPLRSKVGHTLTRLLHRPHLTPLQGDPTLIKLIRPSHPTPYSVTLIFCSFNTLRKTTCLSVYHHVCIQCTVTHIEYPTYDYKINDQVYVKADGIQRKISTPKLGPFRITDVYTNGTVRIQKGVINERINIRRLEPHF